MADSVITPESRYLRALARRVADICVAQTAPAAILLTGSAAQGVADRYSDLDLICYYDTLPSDEATARSRDILGATNVLPIGGREGSQFAEQFMLGGVVCQVASITRAAWEGEMRAVLEGCDVASPAQKAMDGLVHGMPLHGAALVGQWKARAADYPDALARAMVAHHLQLFPIWYIAPALPARDAGVWVRQMLVEGAQHLLGILAGLNRRYYSPFQFKRMAAFAAGLRAVPPDFAARVEALMTMEQGAAALALQALVGETVGLVQREMPDMDTSAVSGRLGKRHAPWELPGPA